MHITHLYFINKFVKSRPNTRSCYKKMYNGRYTIIGIIGVLFLTHDKQRSLQLLSI